MNALGIEARVPLLPAPALQPFLRLGVNTVDSDDSDASTVLGGRLRDGATMPDLNPPAVWDHREFVGALGIEYATRLTREFELATDLLPDALEYAAQLYYALGALGILYEPYPRLPFTQVQKDTFSEAARTGMDQWRAYDDCVAARSLHRTREADSGPAWNRLGVVAAQLGQYAVAESAFRTAVGTSRRRSRPLRAALYVNLAKTLYRLERLDSAADYLRRAETADPETAAGYRFSAVAAEGGARASGPVGVPDIIFVEEADE